MSYCPFCKQEAPADLVVPLLSSRRKKIYSAVVAAGPEGISADDLVATMYSPGEPPPAARTVLRVQIHNANRVLKLVGQRIVTNRCKGYVLTQLAQV